MTDKVPEVVEHCVEAIEDMHTGDLYVHLGPNDYVSLDLEAVVRTVIKTLREPTEAMLSETWVVEQRRAKTGFRWKEHWAWGWRRMIDAALGIDN